MADRRRGITQLFNIGLILQASVFMYATARPSGSSDASLNIAETLLNEALKKEIDDELRDSMARNSREKEARKSQAADEFEELLEAAIRSLENDYEDQKRHAAKAGGGGKKNGKKIASQNGNTEANLAGKGQQSKTETGNGKQAQSKGNAKESLSDSRLIPQGNDMMLNGMGMPKKIEANDLQVYQTDLDSLKPSESGSDSKSAGADSKEHVTSNTHGKENKKFAGTADGSKGPKAAGSSGAHQGKNANDWQRLNDEEIASRISEFYKILQDYANKNEIEREPLDEPMGIATRQNALPLDQPFRMRPRSDAMQQKKIWRQKRAGDNQKLIAEMEQLAATLKKGAQDTSDDTFPPFGKWFRHQRAAEVSKEGRDVSRSGIASDDDDDAVFRRGEVSDVDAKFPWSKYFRRHRDVELPAYQEREAMDKDEENFVNEIEARVAALQQQIGARKHQKRATKLRM